MVDNSKLELYYVGVTKMFLPSEVFLGLTFLFLKFGGHGWSPGLLPFMPMT